METARPFSPLACVTSSVWYWTPIRKSVQKATSSSKQRDRHLPQHLRAQPHRVEGPTRSSRFRSFPSVAEQYKPQETVPGGRTVTPSVTYLPINHDDMWKKLRDPFKGSLNIFDTDFPVRGREDVRCVQIGAGDSSGFQYLPEFRSEKNLAVKLCDVGPQSQERILDIILLP